MISIIDVKDFIDLDNETVYTVQQTLGLPIDEAIAMARQLLASETGLLLLHHMFREQLENARSSLEPHSEINFQQAYAHFGRKYPLPHILEDQR